jgi:cytidine deaminase
MKITDLPADLAHLVVLAGEARGAAYAPYSGFLVGAALRCTSGAVFTGCNVENASFGLTICAERNAAANAVAQGERSFDAVAVVTANGVTPCGACRQFLAEFGPEMTVVIATTGGNVRTYCMRDLLPDAFGPGQLGG